MLCSTLIVISVRFQGPTMWNFINEDINSSSLSFFKKKMKHTRVIQDYYISLHRSPWRKILFCNAIQGLFLFWFYFRFITKKTTHYYSSAIDTINLSAENREKRTKNALILQNYLGCRPPGPLVE